MTDVLHLTKKAFTWSVVVTTILWSVGVAAFVPLMAQAATCPTLESGDNFMIKGDPDRAVYLVTADLDRMYYPHGSVYLSWHSDYSGIVELDATCVSAYPQANSPAGVNYRPGSWLFKLKALPEVYVSTPNNGARAIGSEEVARALFGQNWAQRVKDVPNVFFANYTVGLPVTEAKLVDGMLVRSGSDVQYVWNGQRKTVDGDLPTYLASDVVAPSAEVLATVVAGNETVTPATITADPSQGAAGNINPGTTPTETATGGVSVSLSANTAASANIIADSDTNEYPQSNISFVTVNFQASSNADAKVTMVRFTRSGISADSDLGNLYLYEGDKKIAEYSSFNSKVVTFSNTGGLFTVPAGQMKSLTLRGQLARAAASVTSGKTMTFEVVSIDDVTTAGGSVSGSFPVRGNTMTTAAVADLGSLYVTGTSTYPATVKADEANKELWRLTLNATEQKMQVRRVIFTEVGTIANSDIQNLRLEVAGVQVGASASIADDKTLTFDLSASPIEITAGQSKILILRGDMKGGSGRVFKFTIQRQTDLIAYDAEYGVYVPVAHGSQTGAFSVLQPATGNGTSVDSGTLTIGIATDSPSGNVAMSGTNLTLANYSLTAAGENVKIDSLPVYCTGTGSNETLKNVKVLFNGSQVGTTVATLTCSGTGGASTYTFGNTVIVHAGTPATLSVVGDTTGDNVISGDTVSVSLNTGSSNATGQTTLTALSTTSQTARTLTFRNGTVTALEFSGFTDKTSSNPTGTVNGTGVRIASFVITAGSGEAVDVTQIALSDNATTGMNANYQNLKLMNGSTQIGVTIASLNTAGAGSYTFTPSPAIRIAAGQQYVVDIYADIKSNAADTSGTGVVAYAPIRLAANAVTATGVSTNANASSSNSATGLQDAYIAASGQLRVNVTGDTIAATQLVLGSTGVELASFKFSSEDASEDINVSQVIVSVSTTAGNQGTLKNLRLYKDGEAFGPTVNLPSGSAATDTFWNATFTGLNLVIPRNSNKVITVKADVSTPADGGASGGSFYTSIVPDTGSATAPVVASGASSGASLTGANLDIATSGDTDVEQVGNEMRTYRTKLTVAYAGDSPSGSSVGGTGQVIAKFVISNSSNTGNYSATVQTLNLTMSRTGLSNTTTRALTIYKDSIASNNQLATTNYTGVVNFKDSEITDANTTDVEITQGASKTFIATLDTTDAALNNRLSVGLAQGGLVWGDSSTTGIASVDGLPLISKTFTY